jgi:hypothetical protein
VPALWGVEDVAAGDDATCALFLGHVACWGGSDRAAYRVPREGRERGSQRRTMPSTGAPVASRSMTLEPVEITGVDDAVEITMGAAHACARRSAGDIVCWGDDGLGQGGTGQPSRPPSLRRADPRPVRAP